MGRPNVIRASELTGQRFGRLVALNATHAAGRRVWRCACDCGRECLYRASELNRGKCKTCGQCGVAQVEPGQRFGGRTALHPVRGNGRWLCRCDCGALGVVQASELVQGLSVRCRSCAGKEFYAHHARNSPSRHPLYRTWFGMVTRCTDPKDPQYRLYGGRGIAICERWRSSFNAFLADMGDRPSASHSIDRINNNGNYEPGNCRWATDFEQAQNTRSNVVLELNGVRRCIAEWARRLGLCPGTLRKRWSLGWSDADILTTKPHARRLARKSGNVQEHPFQAPTVK